MTTIVNTPSTKTDSNGIGTLISVILVLGFVGIAMYFLIPTIRNMQPAQITVPAPQVVIPDKVDVNVNQEK